MGPFGRHAADIAFQLNVLSQFDKECRTPDQNSASRPKKLPDYSKSLIPHLHGITIGAYMVSNASTIPESRQAWMNWNFEVYNTTLTRFASLGATIKSFDFPKEFYDLQDEQVIE